MSIVSHVIIMLNVVSQHCLSVYPYVCLSGESYCCGAKRFSANQDIPVSYGT